MGDEAALRGHYAAREDAHCELLKESRMAYVKDATSMARLMRNLFDQYEHYENRLTHALMSSLYEDINLLKSFIQWATGKPAPSGKLEVVEQSLPGGEETEELTEDKRRGRPDGWIFNEEGWALLIESKIASPLTATQIESHRFTARRRGFVRLHILALITEQQQLLDDPGLQHRRWAELYKWLKTELPDSDWAKRLHTYMEVLEARMVKDESLKTGTLTVFAGIPFGAESPYNYLEAKRVLRLAIDQLRRRDDLHQALVIDRSAPGRAAITGKDSSHVWDYLQLARSADAKNSKEFPHLGLGLHRDFVNAFVIVPNALRRDLRRNLLEQGPESFYEIFSQILAKFHEFFGDLPGAAPRVELVQRRYRSQRSEPSIDAQLDFDLRTAFQAVDSTERSPKHQPQWLRSVYDSMKGRNANLQLATGVRFTYDRCPDARTRAILDHIARSWIACRPLIDNLLGP